MSVLVWVHDHFWWLALAVVPCLAAVGWGLWAGRYHPAHAGAGPEPERLWPLVGDPRYGSMQLADDRAAGHEWLPADRPPYGVPLPAPPLDWREVAHEGDWRAQTAADLAPAVLDSGPGGLAWPGPDAHAAGQAWEGDGAADSVSSEVMVRAIPEPEPEAVRTVAGRLVETSDEWLRRLVANAAPGWTYAGTVAA